jgi:uncharacterized membrane protein YoaK (UPF0700 family)
MAQTKLHPWLFVGGCALVLNAGFINTVTFLGFQHRFVSHMTGNVAQVGLELSQGGFSAALDVLLVIAMFVLGATVNGLVIGSSNFSVNQRYSVVLLAQTALLSSALLWMDRGGEATVNAEYVVAVVCGMQNSMTTIYSGAVVRTTHLTGALTDLGSALGHWLRGDRSEGWRIVFFACSAAFFALGSALGIYGMARFQLDALWISVAVYGLLTIGAGVGRLRSEH